MKKKIKSVKKDAAEVTIERLLTTWGVVVIMWSIYRASLQAPVWFDEIVAKPFVFLLPAYIFIKSKNSFTNFLHEMGIPVKKVLKELLFAVAVLAGFVGMGIFMVLTSKGTIPSAIASLPWSKSLLIVAIALTTAFSEELLGRGFLFNHLYQHSKSFIMSLLVSSTLFFILYLPGILTAGVGGQALLINMLINFIISFIAGILFYLRGNVLSSIAFHFGILLWFEFLRGI